MSVKLAISDEVYERLQRAMKERNATSMEQLLLDLTQPYAEPRERERVDLKNLMRTAETRKRGAETRDNGDEDVEKKSKRNSFGYPEGMGPEHALDDEAWSCFIERRFCDGQSVVLDGRVWNVSCAVREEKSWLYDLISSTVRQVNYGSLKSRAGGEIREKEEVIYNHKDGEHLARVEKIHKTDRNPFCDVIIIKRRVDEPRLKAAMTKERDSP